jgi:(S)-3,5-dihydroxyphenylglycine transaminase
MSAGPSDPLFLELEPADLHGSIQDPSLEAVNFLNEIMLRHPDAISFAPGAPYPAFFDEIDAGHYIDIYADHLKNTRALTPRQIIRMVHQYGPSKGLINDLISRVLSQDEGLITDPGSIVVTVGCQEAMFLLLRALRSGPGDLIAVVNPCYVGLIGAARLVDFEVVPIDENNEGIDLDQLKEACRAASANGKRIKAVYVAPDHSNPSGTLMPTSTRLALLEAAKLHDFIIIEDTTYRFTSAQESNTPLLKSLDSSNRVVLLGTFAKTCTPGARVGYIVADQAIRNGSGRTKVLADELAALKTMVTVNTSPICQAIIGGMLIEHDCSIRRLAETKTKVYRKNLECLLGGLERYLGELPQVTWNRPKGGFFASLRLPRPVDSSLAAFSAQQFGVLWTPMSNFYIDGRTSYELRLSCSYLSEHQIDEGLNRLSHFLRHVTNTARIDIA